MPAKHFTPADTSPPPAGIDKDPPAPKRTDPEVQEIVKKRRTPKPQPADTDWSPFVSNSAEPVSFDLASFPPIRWGDRLVWRIPAKYRLNILNHHFCQTGRVREASAEERAALSGNE